MNIAYENTLLTGCPVKRVHITRGCGSFLFDTICPYSLYTAKARQIFLFVCTHRTVGAFFVCRKMAASAQRPVCPVAPLPRPTAPKFGSHPNFRRRSKSPCTLIERTMVQGSGACEKSVGCGWPSLCCPNWRHPSKNFPFWVGKLSILFLLEEYARSYNLREIKTSQRTLKTTAPGGHIRQLEYLS